MTVERDRDQAVERLLRQSLQAPRDSGPMDGCLDAETIAAWADGGLSGDALALAESHLAGCARCLALVGTLARIDTAPPPSSVEHPAMRRWFTWLVPLAAATAVIAIWIAAPREDQGPATQVAEVSQQARADQPTPQPDPALTDGRPAERSKVERPALESPAAANAAETLAESRRDVRQPEADSLKKEAEPVDAVASSAEPAAGAAPQFAAGAAAPAPPPAEEKSAAAALPRAAENTAAPPPAAAPAPSLARRAAAPASAGAARGGEIVSPDPSVRWRIAGSTVQLSVDGGANWEATLAPATVQLTAGSAASTSVCWVVGRGGVVLLTTDGRRWRQVAFPEMTDLAGVRARDARSASVTTADGRPFSTTDGGETWVPRPLQGF